MSYRLTPNELISSIIPPTAHQHNNEVVEPEGKAERANVHV